MEVKSVCVLATTAVLAAQLIVMATITWHNSSEVADLKRKVERLREDLEAEVAQRSQFSAETVTVQACEDTERQGSPWVLKGQKGEPGPPGSPGPHGQQGRKGEEGEQGVPGERGEKGDMGTIGEKGERGDTGLTGPAGQKGEEGPQGPVGEKGEKGDRGISGVPGPKGEKGDTPPVGPYVCGGTTGWHRVAYLDMTNSNHQCPGDMEEVTLSGKRLCGRDYVARRSCWSANFSTSGLKYSQVCGRITGYQYCRPYAFTAYSQGSREPIDSWYVDGVSVTHGPPGSREHVWTFATGYHESGAHNAVCPCAPNAPSNIVIPPFVGQDYFSESAVAIGIPDFQLYPDDPLWDGDGCTVTGNTCCQFNNPPYFTKQLNSTTTDDLEVRACRSWGPGDTLIELIELYIRS